ncbi:bpX6 domain-containing protein [Actinacidiphila soli]|uniref:bpX6 domain-containing protein n=1 Tax=Actinacidiphila soli TaxID=2487275 RepID=UPI000FCAF99F|nr:bpX6 domain-containing protein [Actinacidiphila soli]
MTTTQRFRGSVEARAFVLAAPLIGGTEARARVLELWRPGVTVHRLPTGDWLVVLPEPETVRAERAPGLPLADGPRAGRIDVPQAGEVRTYDTADLPELDPAEWLDLSGYARHTLAALEPPQPPAAALLPPDPSASPDLRATAGVDEASPKALRGLRGMADSAGSGAHSGGTSGTRPPREWAGVTFPSGPAPRLRVHAGLATVHDAEGRIVVLDTARRAPVLSTLTSLA